MASPLKQFEIRSWVPMPELMGYNIDFTNSAAFMTLACLGSIAFLLLSLGKRALVPSRMQSMAELTYEFVANTVKDNVGQAGRPYFPLIFSIFMFILLGNLSGMLPYSFTFTSHIIVTFAMAGAIFLGVTLLAIFKHGPAKFAAFFLPSGTPLWMAPMMIIIELISYISRPISLAIRLAANMMAGHILMKIIAGFVITMGIVAGWVPLGLMVVMTGFEIGIAILHAYIFTVFSCVYLNDALHLH